MTDYRITWTSDKYGKGGQHTNGPDYGILRAEHLPTRTAVEIDSSEVRGQHRARQLAMMMCELAVSEIAPVAAPEPSDG